MTVPSARYRRFAFGTLAATVLLVVVGGIVRVSASGLGCGPAGSGFHGWPLCRGDLVPGLDLNAVIEYVHRVLAAGVGLAILGLAVVALRRYRAHRPVVAGALLALVLVVVQGLLGAATVEQNLAPGLVAAHLALAMVLIVALVYLWRACRPQVPGAEPPATTRAFRALAASVQGFVLLAIVAGGYMAGTQNYGRPDYQLGDGAHHACGREFPACNGEAFPFGQAPLVDVHLTHRVLVYVTAVLLIALVVATLRRRPSERLVRMAWVAAGLFSLQFVVGVLNVLLEEYELLIVAHLTLATLLWGHLTGFNLALRRVPAPASPAAARPQAAGAVAG